MKNGLNLKFIKEKPGSEVRACVCGASRGLRSGPWSLGLSPGRVSRQCSSPRNTTRRGTTQQQHRKKNAGCPKNRKAARRAARDAAPPPQRERRRRRGHIGKCVMLFGFKLAPTLPHLPWSRPNNGCRSFLPNVVHLKTIPLHHMASSRRQLSSVSHVELLCRLAPAPRRHQT